MDWKTQKYVGKREVFVHLEAKNSLVSLEVECGRRVNANLGPILVVQFKPEEKSQISFLGSISFKKENDMVLTLHARHRL
jgi:hypothetical protein